jgi:hypothetical protein
MLGKYTIIRYGAYNMHQKRLVLESLHSLLSHNIIGDKQYNNRYNGFMAELDFMGWYRSNRANKLKWGIHFTKQTPTSCGYPVSDLAHA